MWAGEWKAPKPKRRALVPLLSVLHATYLPARSAALIESGLAHSRDEQAPLVHVDHLLLNWREELIDCLL